MCPLRTFLAILSLDIKSFCKLCLKHNSHPVLTTRNSLPQDLSRVKKGQIVVKITIAQWSKCPLKLETKFLLKKDRSSHWSHSISIISMDLFQQPSHDSMRRGGGGDWVASSFLFVNFSTF